MTPDEGLFPEQLQPWLFWKPDCFPNQDRAGGQKACDPRPPLQGTAPTSELKMVPPDWQLRAEAGEMSWRPSSALACSSVKKEAGLWEGIHLAAHGFALVLWPHGIPVWPFTCLGWAKAQPR